MSVHQKSFHLRSYHLWFIIGCNGFALFIVGLLASKLGLLLGLICGPITFSLAYAVPTKNIFWMELRPFLAIFAGSFLGTALIWTSCRFLQSMVCEYYAFEAQMFINFCFPLIVPVILWPILRLPDLVKRKKRF